jgi:hypothetical protein
MTTSLEHILLSTMTHENKPKINESSKCLFNYESSLEFYTKSVKQNRGDRTPKSNSTSKNYTNKDLENIITPEIADNDESLTDSVNEEIEVDLDNNNTEILKRFKQSIQMKGQQVVINLAGNIKKGNNASKAVSNKHSRIPTKTDIKEKKNKSAHHVRLDAAGPPVTTAKRMSVEHEFDKLEGKLSRLMTPPNEQTNDATQQRNERTRGIDSGNFNINSLKSFKTIKNYSQKDWENIYNNRFLHYKYLKDVRLEQKIIDNEKLKKTNEEKILEEMNNRTKKVSHTYIDHHVNKLYGDAERRRISKQKQIEDKKQKDEQINKTKSSFYNSNPHPEKLKSFSPVRFT